MAVSLESMCEGWVLLFVLSSWCCEGEGEKSHAGRLVELSPNIQTQFIARAEVGGGTRLRTQSSILSAWWKPSTHSFEYAQYELRSSIE